MTPMQATDASGPAPRARRLGRVAGVAVKVALLVALAVVIVRNAWICDDAYITLRTVDNFVGGLGLRWNVTERVQAYTHPLWMFLLAGAYSVTREAYFTTILLSAAVSIVAAVLVVRRFGRSPVAAVFLVAVLASSKAFVDYTTSGLENPLTYLLTVVFLWLYLREDWSPRRLFWLSLVAALVGTTRLDLLASLAPPVAYAAFRTGWRRSVRPLAAGLAPLVAWELFALLYYGFLVPNTAYAKLNVAVDRLDLAGQGLVYFGESFVRDPLTLTVIAAGLVVAFASRRGALVALAVGVVLYLLYVVRIGGDFMSGRYFSSLVIVGEVLLVMLLRSPPAGWVVLAGVAVVLGLAGAAPPILSDADYGTVKGRGRVHIGVTGVADERGAFYHDSGLLLAFDGREMPTDEWAREGRQLRACPPGVRTAWNIGFRGYFAGPHQITIDVCALADPLLARLPPMNARGGWRIGHFVRALPSGYYQTVKTGANCIRDKDVAEYYDRLCRLTRGPLLSPARLWEIVRFNLGLNEHLLRSYCDRPPLRLTPDQIHANADRGGTPFGRNGLEIVFDGLRHEPGIEVRIERGSYCMIPSRQGRGLHAVIFAAIPQDGARSTWRIDVPYYQTSRGFDSLLILPALEDDPRIIESVRLLGQPKTDHGPRSRPAVDAGSGPATGG